MDIERLFRAIIRKAWLLIILAVLGGGLTAYFVSTSVLEYKANSTLLIINRDKIVQTGKTLDTSDLNLSRQLAQDYGSIIHSRFVTSEAMRRIEIEGINENVLNSIVSVTNQQDSSILTVSAIWTDPKTAALICNAMSSTLADKINELTSSNSVSVLDEAQIPLSPLSTNSMRKIMIGIIAGLILGFVIAYVIELFDTTIRAAEDVENGVNWVVIGIVPEHSIR